MHLPSVGVSPDCAHARCVYDVHMTTKRALVSGRIIKHSGRAVIVMRSAHATAHDVSTAEPGSAKSALDYAADRLVQHSADHHGVLDFDVNGKLYA